MDRLFPFFLLFQPSPFLGEINRYSYDWVREKKLKRLKPKEKENLGKTNMISEHQSNIYLEKENVGRGLSLTDDDDADDVYVRDCLRLMHSMLS